VWFEALTEEQRIALLFAGVYEDHRKKGGQFGYRLFPVEDVSIVNHPTFKTFVTITKWLVDNGWNITWKEAHWRGYVEYVFKEMKPSVPQPGQLKNIVLLKKYIATMPVDQAQPAIKTKDELIAMYDRKVAKDIPFREDIMRMLGLRD
jgi:hypothetical protein